MKRSLTIAILTALWGGAALVACGSSGAGSSLASGSGNSSGHGGATASAGHGGAGTGASASTASMSMSAATGIDFDAGNFDGPKSDSDACGSVALTTHLTPGNIVVVFDQSDSMKQPYQTADAGPAGPKYQVAEDALVAALTPDEALLNVGAIFFPTIATGNTCSKVDLIGTPPQIPIEPGATFVADFQTHFSATGWSLILGTPTAVALGNANLALPDPSPFPGERAVVILTDGAPTCDTVQADILAPVQAMFQRGIKTYAVGLPGSASAATLLDAIAQAGGTGTYLSPGDPATLQAALAQIATNTFDKCTITLSPPPPNPSEVFLIVTDMAHPGGYLVGRGDGGGDGWTLSGNGTTATLTGAVCAAAKDGSYTSIQFVYGCPNLPT